VSIVPFKLVLLEFNSDVLGWQRGGATHGCNKSGWQGSNIKDRHKVSQVVERGHKTPYSIKFWQLVVSN
jgi:hypothetical protein